MKKIKLIRVLFFMILLAYSFNAFVGCTVSQSNGLSYEKKFIEQVKHDFKVDEESVEITADAFAQEVNLSAMFSLNIEIIEDNIYIGGALYNKIDYVDSQAILLDDTTFICVSKEITNEKYYKTIEKIKNTEGCYILETDDAKSASKRIAVYVIDSTYYFLSIINVQEVIRIHYIDIE